MKPRHWTITVYETGKPREIELVLYEKVADMRRAASRFARSIGEPATSFNDAEGVCHTFTRIRVHTDGSETEHPLVAIVRLHMQGCSALIVSHEMAHAAQHIYRLDAITEGDLALDHYDGGNELFAHLSGELFAAVWNVLPVTDY